MIISTPQGNIQVNVLDGTYRYRQLMGDNYVQLMILLPGYFEVPVRSTITLGVDTYTLLEPQVVSKHSSRNHEISLRFEGVQALMKNYMYRDINGTRGLKFSLTAKLSEHLALLILNLNERESGWSFVLNHPDIETTITVSHNNVFDVLEMIVENCGVEYEIVAKNVIVGKVEYFKSNPLPLSYGKGKGFLPGIKRENYSNEKQIDILFVQGGERNIIESEYGSRYLRLPAGATFWHLGKEFEVDEFGFSLYLKGRNTPGAVEGSIDLSEFYPKFEGSVTSVLTVDADKHFYDFVDNSIPESLDFNQYIIEGEKPIVIFQSGGLSGKEFEFSGYNHATRTFKIVPQAIDGIIMPNSGAFQISPGSKYIVVNIKMPAAYRQDDITQTGASWNLAREAARQLLERTTPRFSIAGELDGVWLSEIIDEVPRWVTVSPKLKVGGYVKFSDVEMDEDFLVRITGIKEFLNKPTYPKIELSNVSGSKSLSSVLNKIETEAVVTKMLNDETIRFAKRGFREAQETSEALQGALLNFTGSINPVTLSTMQILLGDQSLQFNFVDSAFNPSPTIVTHEPQYNPGTKILNVPAGVIQHKTIGITDVKPNRPASEYRHWTLASADFDFNALDVNKFYYLYAACAVSGITGEFILSGTGKPFQESGNYNLLLGIINSENNSDRNYVRFYGFTEILPGRITADRYVSEDGNKYIDLKKGEFSGIFKFQSGQLVDEYIGDLFEGIKIGGANLLSGSEAPQFAPSTTNSGTSVKYTNETDHYHRATPVGKPLSIMGALLNYQAGKEYIASIYVRQSSGSGVAVSLYNDGDQTGSIKSTILPNGVWVQITTNPFTTSGNKNLVLTTAVSGLAVDYKKVKIEIGTKATDWSPSNSDIKSGIEQAKQDAAEAMLTAEEANSGIIDLDAYTRGAFKDGVISEAEAIAIKKYVNQINAAKEDVLKEYNDLYNNSYLAGTAKANLLNAKITLFGAIDDLLNSISVAIADGKTTTAESLDVDDKYNLYITAYGNYRTAVMQASKAIQDKLNELALKAITDLEVGGENLYNGNNTLSISSLGGTTPTITRNTIETPNGFEIVSSSGGYLTEARISNVVRSNGHHVVSCFIRVAFGTANVAIDICDNLAQNVSVNTDWKLVQAVANVSNYSSGVYNFVDFQTNNHVTIQVKDFMVQKGNKATDFRKSTELLLQALQGSTDVLGGLLATNVILMKNQENNITGGVSGLIGDNIAQWSGGTYNQAVEDAEREFGANMQTGSLDKKDGSGHRAFGKIAWDALGNTYYAGIIEALAGKIGGLNIFENTLRSETMSFSETPVETLSSLMSPTSASISQQSSWSKTIQNQTASAFTQPILLTTDSQLRFRATCVPGYDILHPNSRRWEVRIIGANNVIVFRDYGDGILNDQLYSVNLPAGEFVVQAIAYQAGVISSNVTNTATLTGESTNVIYAYSYTAQTKIGSDGFYSFWSSDRYIYFKSNYGFEGRYGNIGLRFITGQSNPQKMVGGSWSNL